MVCHWPVPLVIMGSYVTVTSAHARTYVNPLSMRMGLAWCCMQGLHNGSFDSICYLIHEPEYVSVPFILFIVLDDIKPSRDNGLSCHEHAVSEVIEYS